MGPIGATPAQMRPDWGSHSCPSGHTAADFTTNEHLPRKGTTELDMEANGINICGCANGAHGIAEALRGFIKATEIAGIRYVVNSLPLDERPPRDSLPSEILSLENVFNTNLLYFNPDFLRSIFYRTYNDSYFRGRRNIGYWFWETDKLNPFWSTVEHVYDEVWAGSEFCKRVFERETSLPASLVPPVVAPNDIEAEVPPILARKDQFVFLCCYDYRSCVERKNPGGVIDAFRMAFPRDRDVLLVLKARSGDGRRRRLARHHRCVKRKVRRWWQARDDRIMFLENYLASSQMQGLMDRCDCLVSLHRSEGFGLHLAESMYREIPVIATGYSGNMDFMSEDNSYLVGYELSEITQRSLPYSRGSHWAEPDVGHAAELMRRVYTHREEARQKAARGAATIRRNHSTERVAKIIRKNLEARPSSRAA